MLKDHQNSEIVQLNGLHEQRNHICNGISSSLFLNHLKEITPTLVFVFIFILVIISFHFSQISKY